MHTVATGYLRLHARISSAARGGPPAARNESATRRAPARNAGSLKNAVRHFPQLARLDVRRAQRQSRAQLGHARGHQVLIAMLREYQQRHFVPQSFTHAVHASVSEEERGLGQHRHLRNELSQLEILRRHAQRSRIHIAGGHQHAVPRAAEGFEAGAVEVRPVVEDGAHRDVDERAGIGQLRLGIRGGFDRWPHEPVRIVVRVAGQVEIARREDDVQRLPVGEELDHIRAHGSKLAVDALRRHQVGVERVDAGEQRLFGRLAVSLPHHAFDAHAALVGHEDRAEHGRGRSQHLPRQVAPHAQGIDQQVVGRERAQFGEQTGQHSFGQTDGEGHDAVEPSGVCGRTENRGIAVAAVFRAGGFHAFAERPSRVVHDPLATAHQLRHQRKGGVHVAVLGQIQHYGSRHAAAFPRG